MVPERLPQITPEEIVSEQRGHIYDARAKRRKQRALRRFYVQMIGLGGICFVSAFGYVKVTSTLQLKQMELQRIHKEIRETQSRINSSQAIIANTYTLEEIELKANELGLQRPLPHQVVYIDMPEQSYTVYTTDD